MVDTHPKVIRRFTVFIIQAFLDEDTTWFHPWPYPKRFGVWCTDRNYKETFPKGNSSSKEYMFSYPSKVSEKQFQKTRSAIVLYRYSEFPDTTRLRCLVTSLIQGLRMSTSQQVNVTTLLLHPSWRLTISHLREKKNHRPQKCREREGISFVPGINWSFRLLEE